jgi:hypothetical protein
LIGPCPDGCNPKNETPKPGICVNVTFCKFIQSQPGGKWTDKSVKPAVTYSCSLANLNYTLTHNQTQVCACAPGIVGLNCGGAGGISAALAAGLTAGILALIIVLGILGAAMCAGGAVAATTAMAAEPEGAVEVNPLYEPSGTEANNPLFAGTV